MNQIRRERIRKYIQEKGVVSVKEINSLFPDVSVMTIHRDLTKLEEERLIIRTRGGAMAANYHGMTEGKLEHRMLMKSHYCLSINQLEFKKKCLFLAVLSPCCFRGFYLVTVSRGPLDMWRMGLSLW